jgi:hydroxymethylpyrimidine kinase / phosphomethylpyrimidine kinase / thiamine-phosphate diphosphorylase
MATSGLYAIVDTVPRLRKVLDAGIGLVQLRIKQPHDADAAWFDALRASLREGVAAAHGAGATLVVNDHWRMGAELGASAVHLGQEDLGRMTAAGFAELAATGMALGVSSHAMWELCRARTLRPAYIACGPVWPTTTKDMPWRPQGLDNLAWWCAHAGRPVAAIGGILAAAQVREAARAGADSVCIVRGLGDDPRQVVPALQDAFAQGRAEHLPGTAPRWPHPSLEADA